MNVEQILSLGPELADFLDEFADCFGRSEPRCHLAEYVRGQLSELPRKSVEPIAPRTLQEFLRTDVWDHLRMRDRVQQIVVGDHDEPQRIGIIDDSGHPKKRTADGVRQPAILRPQRQDRQLRDQRAFDGQQFRHVVPRDGR